MRNHRSSAQIQDGGVVLEDRTSTLLSGLQRSPGLGILRQLQDPHPPAESGSVI